MSFSNATSSDVLGLLFNSAALSGAWSSNLYCSMHTADPGDAGTQATNEISYTGYARVAKTRADASKWTRSGGQVSNADAITFGTMTGGTGGTATHLAVGLASSGAGQIVGSGAIVPPISVVNTTQANFPAGSVVMTLD